MTELFEVLEQPEDSTQPGPGEMMSKRGYFCGTELVRVSIHKKNERVSKLKHFMICYSVRRGSIRDMKDTNTFFG
jgi:hypothetical protein